MDPLSIAASIIGITTAAIQASRLLKTFVDGPGQATTSARSVLREVSGIYACLQQLQGFLLGREEAARSRRSLIMIEQIVVIFTDCVSVFSELEQTLDSIQAAEHMRVLDRLKWSIKENAISKLLIRLQSTKVSMSFMLNILTCTSVESAEASMREMTCLVRELLRTNINMASRLKNLERIHPALVIPSTSTSRDDLALSEPGRSGATSHLTQNQFTFDEELVTSTVYQKAAVTQISISKSSNSSYGTSSWSGLSLCDVNNVSTIALPILSRELWNHHRYGPGTVGSTTKISWDAWYNPPKKKSAFIRTAYFNGQYTNQYSQSKSTGHLVFRRFMIPAPNTSPIFTEGAIMPQSHKELEKIGEEASEDESRFELENTGCAVQNPPQLPDDESGAVHEAVPTLKEALGNLNPDDFIASASSKKPDSCATVLSRDPVRGKALKLSAPNLSPRKIPPDKIPTSDKQLFFADRSEFGSEDTRTSSLPLLIPQPAKPLTQLSPVAFKRRNEVSASRRRRQRRPHCSPACSLFCEEEESIFPTRRWTKPLAEMGDARGRETCRKSRLSAQSLHPSNLGLSTKNPDVNFPPATSFPIMSSTTTAHCPPTAPPPTNDELDDLFDYNVNLDDVFRDVDTNMRAPEQPPKPSKAKNNSSSRHVDSLGIDEAVKVEKKRAPVAKLDEARLLSQAGIPKLRRITKQQLRFKGKGHEYSDVARLLQHYQLWLDELYPKAKFADGLAMIEKLGHSKRIVAMRKEWIKEGKPRQRGGEEDTGLEENAGVGEQDSGNGGDLPPVSANPEETRKTTPPAQNVDDDLYSATPQAVQDQRRRDRDADAGKTLFISDDEGVGGGPSGDELDALLAEDDFHEQAGTVPAILPNRSHDTTKREDAFDDEMEAMAGMDDLW